MANLNINDRLQTEREKERERFYLFNTGSFIPTIGHSFLQFIGYHLPTTVGLIGGAAAALTLDSNWLIWSGAGGGIGFFLEKVLNPPISVPPFILSRKQAIYHNLKEEYDHMLAQYRGTSIEQNTNSFNGANQSNVFQSQNKPAALTKEQRQSLYDEAMEELKNMVGLSNIKEEIRNFIIQLQAMKKLEKKGINTKKPSLHMIFSGPPGSGKTEVARIISKILYAAGWLSKGQLIETDRSGLVGQYIGETAQKTTAKVQEALGGVLFIDEAYALSSGNGTNDNFGQEAIDTLIKAMEDYRDDLVVIMAGYESDMNHLMKANEGFESRIPYRFHFKDYTPSELEDIALIMLRNKGYVADHLAYTLQKAIENKAKNGSINGNGRWVRNFVEQLEKFHQIRIVEEDLDDVHVLNPEDVEKAIKAMR